MNAGIATIAALLLLLPGIGFIVGVNIADKNVREVVFRNTPAELGYVIIVSLVVHLSMAIATTFTAEIISAIPTGNYPLLFSSVARDAQDFNAAYVYLVSADPSKVPIDQSRNLLIFSLLYFLVATVAGFWPGWILGEWVREQKWRWTSFFVKHRWMIALIKTNDPGSLTARAVLKEKIVTDSDGKRSPAIIEGILSDSYFASDGKLLYLVFKAFSILNADGTKVDNLEGIGTLEVSGPAESPADQLVIEGDKIALVRFSRRSLPISQIDTLEVDAD